jgi:spore coat polysaccharide biosynthesis protein SpsF (cytidylyltransferase family)
MLGIPIMIQARIGSSRLPAKPFLMISKKKSVIQVLCKRAQLISKKLGLSNSVYLVTPIDEVEVFRKLLGSSENVIIHGGSENNVAQRYASAMEKYNIDACFRVTSDNPFLVIEVFAEILKHKEELEDNAISFYHQKKLPNGTVISLITKNYISQAAKSSCILANEHLILTKDESLLDKIITPKIDKKLCNPNLRFCLDNLDDYRYILGKNINLDRLSYKYIYKIFNDRKVIECY